MILQVSMLKPSVLMSVPVKKTQQVKAAAFFCSERQLKRPLTFGNNLVHDGPQLSRRDLHVLKNNKSVTL